MHEVAFSVPDSYQLEIWSMKSMVDASCGCILETISQVPVQFVIIRVPRLGMCRIGFVGLVSTFLSALLSSVHLISFLNVNINILFINIMGILLRLVSINILYMF